MFHIIMIVGAKTNKKKLLRFRSDQLETFRCTRYPMATNSGIGFR